MEKWLAEKAYYEIEKPLGAGLTSRVYKAFRRDSGGFTSQPVALKIINSKNDVQIFKKEFETLSKVKSKYCVQILAWENLKSGPALVLEFIEGVTLQRTLKEKKLPEPLIIEILIQVKMGLRSLHRFDVCHGDLNLSNIMINSDGVVKLIDFGFSGVGEQLVTPEFAAPERLLGNPPTCATDEFSLVKLSQYLISDADIQKKWQMGTSRAARRRRLAKLVGEILSRSSCTQRFGQKESIERKRKASPMILAAGSFVFTLLMPLLMQKSPTFYPLEIKSNRWFQYSFNGLPFQYGPLSKRLLRSGKYKIHLKDSEESRSTAVHINEARTFLLQQSGQSL